MADSGVTLSADVTEQDYSTVVDGLVAYNAQHGYPWPWRKLDLVLRNDAGIVIGGILAETNAGWCFIKGLWVEETHRGRGYGGQLLAALEEAARERGCIGVYLDTYSFQARPFYERYGYHVFGTLLDMPPGGAKYYLAKRLGL